jgi:hypothetical protein
MDYFLQKLATLLNNISATNKSCFVLLDANINVLLEKNLETVISNGFLSTVTKTVVGKLLLKSS